MSVKKEASGRRSVQLEVQVPGTPEEVWSAIATGPGVSSWFVPASFEQQDGKPVAMTCTFGPGMEVRTPLKDWNPPHMFSKQYDGWTPGAPRIADEWHVEAVGGGVCKLRIVYSHFADSDEWDNQLEGAASAMPAFLRTLQLYLTHFRGQFATLMQVSSQVAMTDAEAWSALTAALGVQGLRNGDNWSAPAGAPPLSGVVEFLSDDPADALLRLDAPAPGIAALGAFTFPGGPTSVAVNFYLFGNDSADIVARETPRWNSWLEEQFPTPADASN